MSNFKVINVNYAFSTKGEIEFIDLSSIVQDVVLKSEIRKRLIQ